MKMGIIIYAKVHTVHTERRHICIHKYKVYTNSHFMIIVIIVVIAFCIYLLLSVDTKPRLLPNENSQPTSSLVWFDSGMCNNVSEACTHRTANVVVVVVIIIFMAVAVVFVDVAMKSAPHSFISKRFLSQFTNMSKKMCVSVLGAVYLSSVLG